MVVIRTPDAILMDRVALAQWTTRSVRVIRQHCVPIRYEPGGRALYDARACADLLLTVARRHRAAD